MTCRRILVLSDAPCTLNRTEQKEIQGLFYGINLLNKLTFMTDVALMQSFLRRKEISKDQENNEQENFYRLAWGGEGYKEKFVQDKMFCTDRFMSSSRGENQRTFADAGNVFLYIYNVCHCPGSRREPTFCKFCKLFNIDKGLGLLKLADIVLSLINPKCNQRSDS